MVLKCSFLNATILGNFKYRILFCFFLSTGTVIVCDRKDTYLLLLLVEVVDDDPDEEVEREEGTEYDEEYKVDVHVDVDLPDRLQAQLDNKISIICQIRWINIKLPAYQSVQNCTANLSKCILRFRTLR